VVPAGWPDVVLLVVGLEHVDDDGAALRAVVTAAGFSHDLARPRWPLNSVLGTVFALESALVPRWPMPGGASLLLIGRQ